MIKEKRTKDAVVLLGGKFNKIHPGHLWLLRYARRYGKIVVVLANDKNNDRPYALSSRLRKEQLKKTGLVDKVVTGAKNDFFAVVKKYKPDIIIIGHDQHLPFSKDKLSKKIRIIRAKRYGSYRSGEMC